MNVALSPAPEIEVSKGELVRLAAVNSDIFTRTFFPKTVRMASPPKHREMWDALDNPAYRLVNLRAFRGGAKTSTLRLFTAKRIAYGISRTILYVGASEPHAIRSIEWLRNAIDRNKLFAGTFGLSRGKKWNDTEIEIIHGIDERPIWVLGVGITGNIRGINFDDYRPDLIILDDTITDENAATKEQREKISGLIHGALRRSLASAQEEPNAKMANAQTPINPEDAAAEMLKDPAWKTVEFPCWTEETMDLPVEEQESSWPEMFDTATLRKEKISAAQQNKLSIFTREMEIRLISSENASFRPSWLMYDDEEATLGPMFCVLAVDPVPPPSEREVAKGLVGKDYECQAVIGVKNGVYHVLEYVENRGHEPNWSVNTMLRLAQKYRVARIVIETIAYQKVLQWMLETEMKRTGIYYAVVPYKDRRNKFNRITSTLAGPASQGKLFVKPSMTSFISQFTSYPAVAHDDVLDAVAIGLSNLVNPFLELSTDEYTETVPLGRPINVAKAP